jgi:hypothetical protein
MNLERFSYTPSFNAKLFAEKILAMAEKRVQDVTADPESDGLDVIEDVTFGTCLALGQMIYGCDAEMRKMFMEACLKMLADEVICTKHRLPKPTHWPTTTKPQ